MHLGGHGGELEHARASRGALDVLGARAGHGDGDGTGDGGDRREHGRRDDKTERDGKI